MTENLFDIIARMGGTVKLGPNGSVLSVVLESGAYEYPYDENSLHHWAHFIRWAKTHVPGPWHIGLPVEKSDRTWLLFDARTQHAFRCQRPTDAPKGWMFSFNGVDFAEVLPNGPSPKDELARFLEVELRPALERFVGTRIARCVREAKGEGTSK
jgi:hypothetical protein